MRIDPALNNGVGGVDLTIPLSISALPISYSDMMGSTLTALPSMGTWTVTHDSVVVGQQWGYVTWTSLIPSDSKLTVQAHSSTDGTTYSAWEPITKLVDLTVANGWYLQVCITFSCGMMGESPILHDVSISQVF